MKLIAEFVKAFATPAGLMVLFGLIVWGVQLNWGVLQAITKNKEQDLMQQKILTEQVQVSKNVAEAALLLSIVAEDLKVLEGDVRAHHEESERWKEAIRQIEKRIDK